MGSDVKKKSFEKERKKYLAYPQKKKLKLKKKNILRYQQHSCRVQRPYQQKPRITSEPKSKT